MGAWWCKGGVACDWVGHGVRVYRCCVRCIGWYVWKGVFEWLESNGSFEVYALCGWV